MQLFYSKLTTCAFLLICFANPILAKKLLKISLEQKKTLFFSREKQIMPGQSGTEAFLLSHATPPKLSGLVSFSSSAQRWKLKRIQSSRHTQSNAFHQLVQTVLVGGFKFFQNIQTYSNRQEVVRCLIQDDFPKEAQGFFFCLRSNLAALRVGS